MQRYALSAIGRDKPGIVAAIAAVLLEHGLNIEDSQATILRGHFSIVLIVAGEQLDRERLEADIQRVAAFLELDAVSFTPVADSGEAPEPSHMVAVYGVDHPGIVHAAARALAERGIDITDLNTRLLEDEDEEEQPLYALMMEVALPADGSAEELAEALDAVGAAEGVEVTVHELERDEL